MHAIKTVTWITPFGYGVNRLTRRVVRRQLHCVKLSEPHLTNV